MSPVIFNDKPDLCHTKNIFFKHGISFYICWDWSLKHSKISNTNEQSVGTFSDIDFIPELKHVYKMHLMRLVKLVNLIYWQWSISSAILANERI